MMSHKNLFSGALGKLQNIGGSRIYTTPHTVSTPAEYSINVTMNIQGDLVGHSLDGRLWLYRRSRRLGIIALKWDTRKAELEYATGQNISGNDDVVLACGLDWVLTNNNIFMVADDEPYILTIRLFDANIPDTFLYSLLRSGSIGASSIDPFTGEAWGKRDDNGNSEGTGCFSKSTHLLYPAGSHAFEQCYSLLPPVGDWQIFENFLVRRPDAESISSYNYMQAVRPLIPLEFANRTAVYGTGYNFDHRGIQLFHRNGEIFGKGFQNIGKVSLLPAVFSENGTVQEYYLYIQPDFTFYPYSDFFYCNISTFEVNTDDEAHIHSFAVASVARTWNEAKTICETLGGHLATSTSAEKNAFLVSLIGNNTVLLGGSDKDNEGSWQWLTGEGWSYTNWNSGEPNNSGSGEHYLELQVSGGWNDINASTSRYYICEWDYELGEKEFLGKAWQNIALASIGSDALYGFLSEQVDALSGITSFRSLDGRVLLPATSEFLTLSENNARLFFDVLSHKGLLLDNNGGQLMLGEGLSEAQDVNCKTLQQWLAPAGKVDTITDGYIVASADNSAFCTSLITGFNRQFLSPNSIPLTAGAFQDSNEDYYRLAISDSVNESNRKVFGVNKILSQNVTPEAIQWQDVYKEAVKIEFLNSFELNSYPFFFLIEFLYYKNEFDGSINSILDYHHWDDSIVPIFNVDSTFTFARTHSEILYDDNEHSIISIEVTNDTFEHYDNYPIDSAVVALRVSCQLIFIHPDTGQPSAPINLNASFSYRTSDSWTNPYGQRYRGIVYKEMPMYPAICDGKIGFVYTTIDYSIYDVDKWGVHYKETVLFKPVMDIPEQVKNWCNYGECYYAVEKKFNTNFPIASLKLKENFFDGYAIFSEYFSNSTFLQHVPSLENLIRLVWYSFLQYPYVLNTQVNDGGALTSTKNLHVVVLHNAIFPEGEKNIVLVFRSEINPDIFDFYAEIERSKSH